MRWASMFDRVSRDLSQPLQPVRRRCAKDGYRDKARRDQRRRRGGNQDVIKPAHRGKGGFAVFRKYRKAFLRFVVNVVSRLRRCRQLRQVCQIGINGIRFFIAAHGHQG